MATSILSILSGDQILDSNGDPISGAKLYFYDVGTTTDKTVYSDPAMTTPHSQPVVADSAGRYDFGIYLASRYKVILKTSADVTIETIDDIDAGFYDASGNNIFLDNAARERDTIAEVKALSATDIKAGDLFIVEERNSSKWKVITGSVGANGLDLIQCTGVSTLQLSLVNEGEYDVIAFGALDGNGTAAIQRAIDVAEAAGGGTVRILDGQYTVGNIGANLHCFLISTSNVNIVANGINSEFIYTSTLNDGFCFLVTADYTTINGLFINGTANATKASEVNNGCINVKFEDCTNGKYINNFNSGGHYGVQFKSTTGDWTTNQYHMADNNVIFNGWSSGIDTRRASFIQILGNSCTNRQTDGIKTGEGTRNAVIANNICTDNDRDGIDFFDGLIESVVTGNVCEGNTFFGFEMKGTLGGTYGSSDFVFRDNSIAGNTAKGNGESGFSVTSIRNCSFAGNTATSNTKFGFDINTTSLVNFSACSANKNTMDGFVLKSSSDDITFSACSAMDNSYVDGTTQNGTYQGFDVQTGCAAEFIGCHASNSGTTGNKGGQGYGVKFVTGVSSLTACDFRGNVTGDISTVADTDVIITATRVTGGDRLNSFTTAKVSTGDTSINGFVTMTDRDGNTIKLATVA